MSTARLASDPLGSLAARLQALAGTRHPLRLGRAAAAAFERQAREGDGLGPALPRTRAGRTLRAVLERAGPRDEVGPVARLLPAVGEAESLAQRLSAAGLYPLLLLGALVGAGALLFGLSVPLLGEAAALLPEARRPALPLAALGLLAAAMLGLGVLGLALVARLPNPLAGRASRAADQALAYQTALELHRTGVALDEALGAASLWLSGAARAQLTALALQLGAGVTAEGAPAEHRLLAAAAQRGVAEAVLDALATQRRIEAAAAVPDAVLRAQVLTFVLGGLGVGSVAAALFVVYTGLAAGVGGAP